MKFYHGQEKGILRKAFANELPEEVCWRKKNPFPKTHNPQYADIVAKMLMERYKAVSYTHLDVYKRQCHIRSTTKAFHTFLSYILYEIF